MLPIDKQLAGVYLFASYYRDILDKFQNTVGAFILMERLYNILIRKEPVKINGDRRLSRTQEERMKKVLAGKQVIAGETVPLPREVYWDPVRPEMFYIVYEEGAVTRALGIHKSGYSRVDFEVTQLQLESWRNITPFGFLGEWEITQDDLHACIDLLAEWENELTHKSLGAAAATKP